METSISAEIKFHRKRNTIDGARSGYGVVVNDDITVNLAETEKLRAYMRLEHALLEEPGVYDRSGNIEELRENSLEETD